MRAQDCKRHSSGGHSSPRSQHSQSWQLRACCALPGSDSDSKTSNNEAGTPRSQNNEQRKTHKSRSQKLGLPPRRLSYVPSWQGLEVCNENEREPVNQTGIGRGRRDLPSRLTQGGHPSPHPGKLCMWTHEPSRHRFRISGPQAGCPLLEGLPASLDAGPSAPGPHEASSHVTAARAPAGEVRSHRSHQGPCGLLKQGPEAAD